MKTLMISCSLLLGFCMSLSAQTATSTLNLEVVIQNLSSNKGLSGIQVMNEQKKVVVSAYVNIFNNDSKVTFFNLPQGKYAIRFFHDENANGKMDTNMMGVPIESYGFSNNAKGLFGSPPEFSKMIFDASKNTTVTIDAIN